MKRMTEAQRVWAQGTDALSDLQEQVSQLAAQVAAQPAPGGGSFVISAKMVTGGGDTELDCTAQEAFEAIAGAVENGGVLLMKRRDYDGVDEYYTATEMAIVKGVRGVEGADAEAVFSVLSMRINRSEDGGTYTPTITIKNA